MTVSMYADYMAMFPCVFFLFVIMLCSCVSVGGERWAGECEKCRGVQSKCPLVCTKKSEVEKGIL